MCAWYCLAISLKLCMCAEGHAHEVKMSQRTRQFGQRSPPVSVAIKQILQRYPDGQIFKVIYIILFVLVALVKYNYNAILKSDL